MKEFLGIVIFISAMFVAMLYWGTFLVGFLLLANWLTTLGLFEYSLFAFLGTVLFIGFNILTLASAVYGFNKILDSKFMKGFLE